MGGIPRSIQQIRPADLPSGSIQCHEDLPRYGGPLPPHHQPLPGRRPPFAPKQRDFVGGLHDSAPRGSLHRRRRPDSPAMSVGSDGEGQDGGYGGHRTNGAQLPLPPDPRGHRNSGPGDPPGQPHPKRPRRVHSKEAAAESGGGASDGSSGAGHGGLSPCDAVHAKPERRHMGPRDRLELASPEGESRGVFDLVRPQ